MPRFVVLDHSLTRVGGHNYEQSVQVLRAAQERGFGPVLVTNRRFKQQDLLPDNWKIIPVFEHESYDCLGDYPLDVEGAPLGSDSVEATRGRYFESFAGLLTAGRRYWRGYQRRRRLRQIAGACEIADGIVHLRDHDHVFLPTTSLFDLLGVARWIQSLPNVPRVLFHGLFHYGFLRGREPDYAAQAECQFRVRQQLEYLLRNVPAGQLRLYGTTEKLAEQYNRLGLTEFGVLPFPVDHRTFLQDDRGPAADRIRLTCAGFLRREKGKVFACQFVRGIWKEELEPGRIQLVVQTNRRQARRMLPPEASVPLRFRSGFPAAADEPIVWLRHPLTREAYTGVIRNSDAAIFLHDGQAYYTRCSGVLVEMLAGGVPVLVPAGSWLADQVSQPIYEHLDDVRRRATILKEIVLDESACRAGGETGVVAQSDAAPTRPGVVRAADVATSAPREATSVLVSFHWGREIAMGSYVQLVVEQLAGGAAEPSCTTVSILGARQQGTRVSSLFPLRRDISRVRVSLSNAYSTARLAIGEVSICFLGAPRVETGSYPGGKVGLIFANVDQLPSHVRDMREHYAHYRESARYFARSWRKDHDPGRIVDLILANSSLPARAVA